MAGRGEKSRLLAGWFQAGLAVAPVSLLLAWAEVDGFGFAEKSLAAAAWSVLRPRTQRGAEEGEEASQGWDAEPPSTPPKNSRLCPAPR